MRRIWQWQGYDTTAGIFTVLAQASLVLKKPIRIHRVLAQASRFDSSGGYFPCGGYMNMNWNTLDRPVYGEPQEVNYNVPVPPAVVPQAVWLFPIGGASNWIDVGIELPGGETFDFTAYANTEVALAAGDTLLVYGSVEYEFIDE